MTEPDDCRRVVFRALLRSGWFDGSEVKSAAYIRREGDKDKDGISVDVESVSSCVSGFNDCRGAASLLTGKIRDLGLDVRVDTAPHANIVGLPLSSENLAEAERLAGQLASISRVASSERTKNGVKVS